MIPTNEPGVTLFKNESMHFKLTTHPTTMQVSLPVTLLASHSRPSVPAPDDHSCTGTASQPMVA